MHLPVDLKAIFTLQWERPLSVCSFKQPAAGSWEITSSQKLAHHKAPRGNLWSWEQHRFSSIPAPTLPRAGTPEIHALRRYRTSPILSGRRQRNRFRQTESCHRDTATTAAKLLQSCSTLCDAIDGSPLGSPVPGILQARTVSGLPLPSPMHESENESAVAQSCPTLSDPTDCSLPGFSVHRIFWKELQEALFQEAGKGSSQDVGKESLLRGRIGGHLFCVANLYLEGTG